jgi:hypothetical protein
MPSITIAELKSIIANILVEGFYDNPHIYRGGTEREKELQKQEKLPLKGQKDFRSAVEMGREEEISEMQELPEYMDVESFVEFAINDEQATFTDTELHAITRNVFGIPVPNGSQIKKIRAELESYGLKLLPREPVKAVRGARSNMHGTHPFAGAGAGGTGFSSGGLGLGTGPGAIGGKVRYDATKAGSLPMGSRRR